MSIDIEDRLRAYGRELDSRIVLISVEEIVRHHDVEMLPSGVTERPPFFLARVAAFAAAALVALVLLLTQYAIDEPTSDTPAPSTAATVPTPAQPPTTVAATTSTVPATSDSVFDNVPNGGHRPPPTTYAAFFEDLEYSRAILGGVAIGDPCDAGDGTYITDPSSPQPILVPAGSYDDADNCTIRGWVYRALAPADIPAPPPGVTAGAYPVFDESGNVIDWKGNA